MIGVEHIKDIGQTEAQKLIAVDFYDSEDFKYLFNYVFKNIDNPLASLGAHCSLSSLCNSIEEFISKYCSLSWSILNLKGKQPYEEVKEYRHLRNYIFYNMYFWVLIDNFYGLAIDKSSSLYHKLSTISKLTFTSHLSEISTITLYAKDVTDGLTRPGWKIKFDFPQYVSPDIELDSYDLNIEEFIDYASILVFVQYISTETRYEADIKVRELDKLINWFMEGVERTRKLV